MNLSGNILYNGPLKWFVVNRWRNEEIRADRVTLSDSALIFEVDGEVVATFNNHSPHGWSALVPKSQT